MTTTPDPVRKFAHDLFGRSEPPADEDAPESRPNVVSAEGGNPTPASDADAELREFTRDLFGSGD
jgi:hypothetical protein